MLISFLGTIPFIFVHENTNLIWLKLVLFVFGMGIGGLQIPMMTDIFIGLEKKDIPGTSVGQIIIQNVGSAVISAVVTAVVTSEIAGQMTTKLHQLAAMHTNLTPTVIARAKTSVEKAVTLNGYQLGFLVSSIVLTMVAIPAMFLSQKKVNK
ncbi:MULTISPECIES: hypothetical protein [Lactococcus]|uniref:hypothetical protein n=1 Tax=Lactococcus TaxID=1357 RepID=UPI001CDC0A9C|nr:MULTISPECIES: hypothetical protein [Lactococcus]MCA2389243.1 hypothetical protein [Lactococcus sp. NH2-7C]MCI1072272.1 hypothetical protein [Lactococcus lactis]WGV29936.1 hypothetical protein QJV49_10540 [Lactococcus sp. NH2-7C]